MEVNAIANEVKSQSKIALEGFVAYKELQDKSGFEFYPQPRWAGAVPARDKIVLGDIPLPNGVKGPVNALTLLCAGTGCSEFLKKQAQYAKDRGMEFVKVKVELRSDGASAGKIRMVDVSRCTLLDLNRLSCDLQSYIVEGVIALAAKRGMNEVLFERIEDVVLRSELLCELIHADPFFRRIRAVVCSVETGEKTLRLAFIDPSDVINYKVCGNPPFHIVLPGIEGGCGGIPQGAEGAVA